MAESEKEARNKPSPRMPLPVLPAELYGLITTFVTGLSHKDAEQLFEFLRKQLVDDVKPYLLSKLKSGLFSQQAYDSTMKYVAERYKPHSSIRFQ